MTIVEWLATGPLGGIARPVYHVVQWYVWRARTESRPTPHMVKQSMVREYAKRYGLHILVETGTYLGDMVWAVRKDFDEIHSIELQPGLYERARRRFASIPNISIHEGDSGRVLPEILERLDQPALFWLDGHYSGRMTAGREQRTPIIDELTALSNYHRQGDVLLIDDAHLFKGERGYPSLDVVRALVARNRDVRIEVVNDVVRVTPH
jgi:hypothetical protein